MTDNYSRQQINTKQDHAKEQTFIMGGQGCETPGNCRFWDYKLKKMCSPLFVPNGEMNY